MAVPRFEPLDILNLATPSGVDRVVLIQMSYYGNDNRYMLDTIAERPETFRGVAVIDPRSPDIPSVMRELADRGIRGFRIHRGLLTGAAEPDHWLDAYEGMFRAAAPLG